MTTPLPDASEGWIDAIVAAVDSDARACGWFDDVNGAEPKSAPGHGLTCAHWVQAGPDPLPVATGLDVTSAVLTFNVRVYTPWTSTVEHRIDPRVAKSVSALMRRWHEHYDFGLHPMVRNVDLLGHSGIRLGSRAGYVEVSGQMCRVMTITLPIICNDVWPQGSSS